MTKAKTLTHTFTHSHEHLCVLLSHYFNIVIKCCLRTSIGEDEEESFYWCCHYACICNRILHNCIALPFFGSSSPICPWGRKVDEGGYHMTTNVYMTTKKIMGKTTTTTGVVTAAFPTYWIHNHVKVNRVQQKNLELETKAKDNTQLRQRHYHSNNWLAIALGICSGKIRGEGFKK